MKKKIVFLADSAVDLFGLYEKLNSTFEIIWVVYHKTVYQDLKNKKIDNVFLSNLGLKILNKNNLFSKIIKIFIFFVNNVIGTGASLTGTKQIIKITNSELYKTLENIEKKYSPVFILTDTVMILSEYKTKLPKISLLHSVCYKKFFLQKEYGKFDLNFIPGFYHKKRIQNFLHLDNEEANKKLQVVGNIKISHFINDKNFNKDIILKKIGLKNKINILFAPTHNTQGIDFFGRYRFFPKKFGNQFDVIKKLNDKLNVLNCNLIIKLHHHQNYHLRRKTFNELDKKDNCYIFKSGKYHDKFESNDIFKISDIVITDTSGVATTAIFLKKKIIFMEPSSELIWKEADIEKENRPGFICNNIDEIFKAIHEYTSNNDPFEAKKLEFVKKIFYNSDLNANNKIAEIIKDKYL